MKIEGTATIGEKGQIVIPKLLRNKFNLKPGDDLILLSGKKGIFLVKSDNLKNMIDNFEDIIQNDL